MTVTTENLASSTNTQYLLSTYYDRLLLERLEPKTRFYQFAMKKRLPKGEGRVIKWTAFKNAPIGSTLTEGSVPAAIALSTFNVTATLVQKGAYTTTSDVLELTAIDNVVKDCLSVMADAAGRTVDTYLQGICAGVTDVSAVPSGAGFYLNYSNANGAAAGALSTLTSGAVITVAEIRKVVTALRSWDVPAMDDGYYVGIIHPACAAILEADSTWATWNQYTKPEAMYKGEIGKVEGVRFVDSTLCYTTVSGTASPNSTTAYFTYIMGKGAYGTADLNGGVKTMVKKPNQYDTSDPLNQRSTIGYKVNMAAAILNISCGRILVSASSNA